MTRKDDPAVYEALATKLLSRRRPAEAVAALQGALANGGDAVRLAPRTQDARAQRSALSKACLKGGSLTECDDALLSGEPDEIPIQLRRGELLRAAGQNSAALQAYMSAQSRDPKDKGVAHHVLELSASEIKRAPDDASLRGAEADAHYALGEMTPAIAGYRDAFRLGLKDAASRERLSAALEKRAAQVKGQCLRGTDPAICRELMLAGEPDEKDIRAHIAVLERSPKEEPPKSEPPKVETQEPAPPVLVSLKEDQKYVAEPVAEAEKTPIPPKPDLPDIAPPKPPEVLSVSSSSRSKSAPTIAYSNTPSSEGTTH